MAISYHINITINMGGINTDIDPDASEYRSTRLVCAKLYEGGLLACNSILNSIKKRPFTARNPEYELNMVSIGKHAEKAFLYHIQYAYLAAGLAAAAFLLNIINPTVSALFVAATIILLCGKSMHLDKNIALNNFSKMSFNPGYNLSGVSAEYNIIETDLNVKQNIITFGSYYPFLGAGIRARNWNFSIDALKPLKKLDGEFNSPDDVSTDELYNAVAEGIKRKKLPNISYDYILFADGNEVDKSAKLLPNKVGRPKDNLDTNDLIHEGQDSTYNDWRTYFCIQYHDKLRSTLFSTFLRFSKLGADIFTECSFYVLPPINEQIYNIDKLALYDDLRTIKMGLKTLALLVIALAAMSSDETYWLPPDILLISTLSPLYIVFKGRFQEFLVTRGLKKKIERGEPHNYGANLTFREAIASPNYKNYFSAQDLIMVQNTIEQSIVYSVADLLDSKGIDSSFLRKEMIAYVNQGIMMFGGEIKAKQIATGVGAQAINQIRDHVQKLNPIRSEVK